MACAALRLQGARIGRHKASAPSRPRFWGRSADLQFRPQPADRDGEGLFSFPELLQRGRLGRLDEVGDELSDTRRDPVTDDFSLAAAAAVVVARAILERGLEPAQLLNVNVPAIPLDRCAGIEVTRLGKRIYQDELIRRADPRGVPYYWVGGPPPTGQAIPGTDVHAVLHDRVSITPIQLDLTADRFLERLRGWELRIPG
jgi:hypothetical protein